MKEVASRLQLLRRAGLPGDLCKAVPPKLVERCARRSAAEEPNELRRHAEPLKATLMPAFSCRRTEDFTEQLADLLVETVHKIGKGAEKKIDGGIAVAHQEAPSKT